MTKLLVVNNSMRPKRASSQIAEFAKSIASAIDGVEVAVADLRDLDMPFFNAPVSPADPSFEIVDPSVLRWSSLVQEADAVVTLTPEYNHGMAASQKNAIDWLYEDWKDKPVVAIGYGWGGAKHALPHLNDIMHKVGANILVDDAAHLYFTKTINLDGSILDEAAVQSEVSKSIQAVLAAAA